jgi:hypothetical protein
MLAIISGDKSDNCKIMLKNCAPYDITIERNDLMGKLEIEEEKLIPLTNDIISSVCSKIQVRLPKIRRKKLSREHIAQRCNLQAFHEFQSKYINILFKHFINVDK